MAPDLELVDRYVREGSDGAFGALVDRHVDLVFATALRQVGDAGLAEEITQNVFIALARKAPRLAGVQTLAGWLYRTTLLESKARIRAELRRRRREDAAAETMVTDRQGTSPLEAMLPLLDEALLTLRDADRLALVVRFLEGRSLREVAGVLGVEEDAARKRVSRALERVTEFFRQRGFAVATVGGAATLLGDSAHAAPAGLGASVSQAGLAAAGTPAGLSLLVFKVMALTKTQTTLACLVVAAVPLAWQWEVSTALAQQQAATQGQQAQLRAQTADLEADVRRAQETLARTRRAAWDAGRRRARLEALRAGTVPPPSYQWDDDSPVVRIPKEFLQALEVNAVRQAGQLTDQIKEALQLNPTEVAATQAALDAFLAGYQAAQKASMIQVSPTEQELDGHTPEDTRVFEYPESTATIQPLRRRLFAELEAALGAERAQIFQRNLRYWMPVDDANSGISTGMEVIPFAHRVRFHPSVPGVPWLGWGLVKANGEGLSGTKDVDGIPDYLRPALQDWIDQAGSTPASE